MYSSPIFNNYQLKAYMFIMVILPLVYFEVNPILPITSHVNIWYICLKDKDS